MRFIVTKTSKAAKKYSAEHPNTSVWYFRKGNNEGFLAGARPTANECGFADNVGLIRAKYFNGIKVY